MKDERIIFFSFLFFAVWKLCDGRKTKMLLLKGWAGFFISWNLTPNLIINWMLNFKDQDVELQGPGQSAVYHVFSVLPVRGRVHGFRNIMEPHKCSTRKSHTSTASISAEQKPFSLLFYSLPVYGTIPLFFDDDLQGPS
jgi:hypothetical protein